MCEEEEEEEMLRALFLNRRSTLGILRTACKNILNLNLIFQIQAELKYFRKNRSVYFSLNTENTENCGDEDPGNKCKVTFLPADSTATQRECSAESRIAE